MVEVLIPGDSTTDKSDLDYVNRRAARYAALRKVWRISNVRRLALCRRVGNGDDIGFRLKGVAGEPGARAAMTGLQTCGSVWSCPVCSEIVNAQRQAELETGLTRWLDEGHSATFVTLTLQHHQGDDLTAMWDALAVGWNKLTGSVAWRGGKSVAGMRDLFSIAGTVRLVEVKHGAHGWHPHLHLILFHERGDLDDTEVEQLRALLFGKWANVLGRAGFKALEFDKSGQPVGVDVRRIKDADYIAEYMAKNGYRPQAATAVKGAAYEVTGSHSKQAGKGGRTPFQILAEIVSDDEHWTVLPDGTTWVDRRTGELASEAVVESSTTNVLLWRQWEKASKGRRQLTWSRGLRDRLGLGVEDTDEDVVDKNALQGEPVDTGAEPPIRYTEFADWGRTLIPELLRAVETGEIERFLCEIRANRSKRDNSDCRSRTGKPVVGRQLRLSL